MKDHRTDLSVIFAAVLVLVALMFFPIKRTAYEENIKPLSRKCEYSFETGKQKCDDDTKEQATSFSH